MSHCLEPESSTSAKKQKENLSSNSEDRSAKDRSAVGPQLPPHFHKHLQDESTASVIRPRLPTEEPPPVEIYGPQVPPDLKKELYGPQLLSHLPQTPQESSDDDSDEEVYGPLPPSATTLSKSHVALEERALLLKMDQLEPQGDKPKEREEWMLELPEVKAAKFGLGSRQFRKKAGPDMSDRSSWTDTPNQKKVEKVDLKKESECREIRRRDEEQERMADKHKRKSKESLLQMHQSKQKKKKEEESSERRPFSRDIDLQVNRFDEAQKKAVLKKAQLLDDRFSSGKSKFL